MKDTRLSRENLIKLDNLYKEVRENLSEGLIKFAKENNIKEQEWDLRSYEQKDIYREKLLCLRTDENGDYCFVTPEMEGNPFPDSFKGANLSSLAEVLENLRDILSQTDPERTPF